MEPKIETLSEKKLIGKSLRMSFADNKTGQLWGSFMPRRKELTNAIGTELYSVQLYTPLFFAHFDPHRIFEKWAAAEVSHFDLVPEGMETLVLPSGLYAVFFYKGSSLDTSIFQYIFGTWIPNSKYDLDDRPYFEVLGEKYKNADPNSEEEIWIPIRDKQRTTNEEGLS